MALEQHAEEMMPVIAAYIIPSEDKEFLKHIQTKSKSLCFLLAVRMLKD